MSLYAELKRRNVFRVALAYLALAWLLTEVAGTIFPVFGIPDWGVRFVVLLFALGFMPALVFSWVYELTPEGLKRERDVVREASITHLTAKRLDLFTIAIMIVALGFILADRLWLTPRLERQSVALTEAQPETTQIPATEKDVSHYPPNSIAVLPFVNMSDDAANEYFSDGISEELLNHLSEVPELRVISRSSAFSFKGKDMDIPTIARRLNVAHVIEGSVRKAGNRVRITAQLIDARSDSHLWSKSYDRELENIFDIQDEISMAIVNALRESLNLGIQVVPRAATSVNTEAHDAYLRGRHLVVQRTQSAIEGAVQEFEKAVALDPDYALAHAELAIAILLLNFYGDLTVSEVVAWATPHAEHAVALNPNLAEAHAAVGFLSSIQSNFDEALIHYRRAIQINPNYSSAYLWMEFPLNYLGRYKEMFSTEETAFRLDPQSIPAIVNYVLALVVRGRLDEAGRELERLVSISPARFVMVRGFLEGAGGRWASSVLGTLEALRINPEITLAIGHAWPFAYIGLDPEPLSFSGPVRPVVLRMLGRPKEAVAAVEIQLAEDSMRPTSRFELGLALAAAGDYSRARPMLEEGWQRSSGRVTRDGLFQIQDATALIAIRRDAGEETGIDELLDAMRDNVRRLREAAWVSPAVDYEEGLAAYLSGERDRGLASIARASENGYFILPNEAYLQALYDDPGFAPIRAGQEARQVRERSRVLAVVCTDNPYAEVWQPAKGTCERFAAESEH